LQVESAHCEKETQAHFIISLMFKFELFPSKTKKIHQKFELFSLVIKRDNGKGSL
jgi:hypothetical protein